MRNKEKRFFSGLCLAALLITSAVPALGEETENYTVCTVNGTALTNWDFLDTYVYYMEIFAASGYDTEDAEVQKYVEDKAYTATVENQVLLQGMEEDGYYTFSDEEEEEFAKEGDLEAVARKQAAMDRLYSDLMADVTITDEDVEKFYENASQANDQEAAGGQNEAEGQEEQTDQSETDAQDCGDDETEADGQEQAETELSEDQKAEAREWLWDMALEERLQAYIDELEGDMVLLTVADPDYSSYRPSSAEE